MLKNLILLTGFSTFVVFLMIALNIYHGRQLSSVPQTTQTHSAPITPAFDKKTIDSLKKRIPVDANLQEKTQVVTEDSAQGSVVKTSPKAQFSASNSAQQLVATTSAQP